MPLRRFIAGSLCIFLIGVPPAALGASAGEIRLVQGEVLEIVGSGSVPATSVQWILERASAFLETQTTPIFQRSFVEPGLYTLRAKTVSPGGEVLEYPFAVSVAASPERHTLPLKAALESQPASRKGVIVLPLRGGTVMLDPSASEGEISEYRIDLSSSVDSDGDGVKDNDIDNSDHPSLRTGEAYPVSIRPGLSETARTITLTVLSSDGRVDRETLQISFLPDAPLSPFLQTVPPVDAVEGAILLKEEGGIVRLDARESQGLIREYILDTDVSVDTNGDLETGNDNDTAGTRFSRTGQPLYLFLAPRNGQPSRTLQLTVVDRSGNSNSSDLPIHFKEESAPSTEQAAPRGHHLALAAEPPVLRAGEVSVLRVEGDVSAFEGITYAWDSGGDGSSERETKEPTISIRPDAPGILVMQVSLTDASGREQVRLEETFEVEPPSAPALEETTGGKPLEIGIETSREEEGVRFTPVVTESFDLASFDLLWSFGDGATSALEHPVHQYEESGTYTVTLELHDPKSGETVARSEEEVRFTPGVVRIPDAESEGGTTGTPGNFLSGFLFMGGMVLLVALLLFVVLAVCVVIVARKRGQSPWEFLSSLRRKAEDGPSPELPVEREDHVEPAPVAVRVKEGGKNTEGKERIEDKAGAKDRSQKPESKPDMSTPPAPPSKSPTPAVPTGVSQESKSSPPPKAEVPTWLKQASSSPPPPIVKEEQKTPSTPSPSVVVAPQPTKADVPPWLKQTPSSKPTPEPSKPVAAPETTKHAPTPQPVTAPPKAQASEPTKPQAPTGSAPAWLQKGMQGENSQTPGSRSQAVPQPQPAPSSPQPKPQPEPEQLVAIVKVEGVGEKIDAGEKGIPSNPERAGQGAEGTKRDDEGGRVGG